MILPDHLLLARNEKGYALYANREIKEGELLFSFKGKLVNFNEVKDTSHCLTIDDDLFLESSKADFDDYINHSCNPNCCTSFDDPLAPAIMAMRNIAKGEEISFDYNSTEFDLLGQGCSFICRCNSENCIGEVRGFMHLPEERQLSILNNVSPYIRKRFEEKR